MHLIRRSYMHAHTVMQTHTLSLLQHYCSSCYVSPMNPPGKHGSVLTFPSTFTNRWASILVTSFPFNAYFNLFRRKMISGRHSLSLCGPGLGRGA